MNIRRVVVYAHLDIMMNERNKIPIGMQLKLLHDVGNPPRPKLYDDDVTSLYLDRLVPRVMEWLRSTGDVDSSDEYMSQLRSDIAEATDHSNDGYEMARYLERHCYWECDSALVEILDGSMSLRLAAKYSLVEQWVLNNGIIPEYSVGQRVTFRNRGKIVDGEITKVEAKRAQYIVFCESLGHVRPPTNGTTGVYVGVEDIIKVESA